MVRAISDSTLALLSNPVGLEPITIIAISWGSKVLTDGTIETFYSDIVKYADKDILDDQGNIIIPGRIMSMSNLDDVIKIDTGSSSASLSVVLSDGPDSNGDGFGDLKALYNVRDLHKRPVIVYQYFDGLDPTINPFTVDNIVRDPFEVFRGEIASPVTWSEGQRTLSFDIIAKVYELEAGFAPEQGQYAFVPPQLVNKVWPMVFGTPIHIPATKYEQVLTGNILSTFGVPDATLIYKFNLMQFVQQDLINSYNYYNNLITVAEDIEVPAYQIQEEYANHIVNHDAMKQTVEDLHDQLTTLNQQVVQIIAQYNDDASDTTRAELDAELAPIRDERRTLNEAYQRVIIQAKNMQDEAEGYKLRLKNAKFETTVVNKLRAKCRALLGDYYNCTRQLDQISTSIRNQTTINQNSAAVMVGPEFPQNVTASFNINGVVMSGIMSGYSLSQLVPQPIFTNLQIGPPQDADVTAFWLLPGQTFNVLGNFNDANNANSGTGNNNNGTTSTTIPNLTGMYLLLGANPSVSPSGPTIQNPLDYRIVQVVSQAGLKVNVNLVRKQRNPRFQKQQINYTDDKLIQEKFESTLERLLTGNETEQQIAEVASNIPRDISPKIWNILNGGSNVIYIELVNTTTYDPALQLDPPPNIDLDTSSFTLCYNNEELTDEIFFTDSPSAIETKILNSTLSIDDNDITVTIDKYWDNDNALARLIKIKFNGLMRPLTLFDSNIVNNAPTNNGKVSIRQTTTESTGCYIRYNRNCLIPTYTLAIVGKFKDNGDGPESDQTIMSLTAYEDPIITLYFRGYKVDFNPNAHAASDVQQLIYDLDPAFEDLLTVVCVDADDEETSDTTLLFNDFFIDFNTGLTSIFVDTNKIQYRAINFNTENIDLAGYKPVTKKMQVNQFTVPNVSVEMEGGGAHEFTYNQRKTMLQNMVTKNANAPGIEKFRNRIRDLIKEAKANAADAGAAGQQAAKEAIYEAMTAYRAMAKSTDQASFSNDKAYKLISDEEYGLLYDMEVTGYTEWVNSLNDIDEEFEDDIDYEFTMVGVNYIREAANIILPRWLQRLNLDPTLTDSQRAFNGTLTSDQVLYEIYVLPNSTSAWLANVGDTISLAGGFQENYVCSIIPGTIKAVYAVKQVAGINRLIPVPSRYYQKTDISTFLTQGGGTDFNEYLNCVQIENDNLGFADFGLYHGVTVSLFQPLSIIDPTWSDQLYVTVESLVGPNVCDILSWIIRTYTDLSIDLTTFQHVWSLQQNYPCNFVLLQKFNCIQLLEEIAWQARCTLWIKNGTVYIRYLLEDPTPFTIITKKDIEQASLELSYTPTEDIITKLVGTWKETYAQTDDYTITLRRNLTRYNEVTDTREMYIYNIRDLVWKSLTWWIIRRATTWRLVKFKLPVNRIQLETQDYIWIDLNSYDTDGNITVADNTITVGPIKALITKADYNSTEFGIDIECWLPVVAGQQLEYQFAFPRTLNEVDSWPMISDIAGGDAGSPLNMQVPNGLVFNYNSLDRFTLPLDMGRPNVGDSFDSLPENPADPFAELDYETVTSPIITVNANLNADVDGKGVENAVPDAPTVRFTDFSGSKGHLAVGQHYTGTIVSDVAYDTQYLSDGSTKQIPYKGNDIYLVLAGDYYRCVKFINIDARFTLKIGTPVEFWVDHGLLYGKVVGPLAPEVLEDQTGQQLDDAGISPEVTNPDGSVTGGAWF